MPLSPNDEHDTRSRPGAPTSGSSMFLSCSEMARAYTPEDPVPSAPSSFPRSFPSIMLWMTPRLFWKLEMEKSEHECCTALIPAATTMRSLGVAVPCMCTGYCMKCSHETVP